jgi:hypothetical protein
MRAFIAMDCDGTVNVANTSISPIKYDYRVL